MKNFLAGGLNILNKISGILNCGAGGGGKCHIQNTYELNKGSKPQPSAMDNQNFISILHLQIPAYTSCCCGSRGMV